MLDLPARERSFYGAAPLVEVVCQIRFPKLLVLESDLPVQFQERVGADYPILETRSSVALPVAFTERDDLPVAMRGTAFDFFDEAHETKVTLASDFLAVSTAKYGQWEQFRERIAAASEALLETYEIRLFQRIGLRYQNVIRPHLLGITGARPSDLLLSELLGPAADMGARLRAHQSTTTFDLDDGAAANLGVAITYEGEEKLPAYVVDCDTYREGQAKADIDGTLGLLDSLHGHASHIFRWCIQEKLHKALEPNPC